MKKIFIGLSLALFLALGTTANVHAQTATTMPLASTGMTSQAIIKAPIAIGAKGDSVTALQQFLIAKGFLTAITSPTGYFGTATSSAISAFQAANNLPQVGMVGPKTIATLQNILSSSASATTTANMPTMNSTLPAGCTSPTTFNTLTGAPCGANTNTASNTSGTNTSNSNLSNSGTISSTQSPPTACLPPIPCEVYVADAANARIQAFKLSGAFITKWGMPAFSDSVAVAPNGNVYAANATLGLIQEFTSMGTLITQWGTIGSGNGQFRDLLDIAVAPNGNVYATDITLNRIQEFTPSGVYITQWGSYGSGNGQFINGPYGVAVAPNGNVYATDGNNRVQEFTSSGVYITQFGTLGVGNGQFNSPIGIAVAPNGNVYVGDSGSERIEEFTPAGNYITQWGTPGNGNGQFSRIYFISISSSGNIYVADVNNFRIQVFSSNGTYLRQWGTAGSHNGQFVYAFGVAVCR